MKTESYISSWSRHGECYKKIFKTSQKKCLLNPQNARKGITIVLQTQNQSLEVFPDYLIQEVHLLYRETAV